MDEWTLIRQEQDLEFVRSEERDKLRLSSQQKTDSSSVTTLHIKTESDEEVIIEDEPPVSAKECVLV